jgi:hypothetical protein
MKTLLRSFYDLGHLTNAKSYTLYSSKLKKHDYYWNFFMNYNYCSVSLKLNQAYDNQLDTDKIREEFKLNSFYLDKNIGLFVYPNLCLKHIHTIHNSNSLKNKQQKKIFQNVMNQQYEKIIEEFNKNYQQLKI